MCIYDAMGVNSNLTRVVTNCKFNSIVVVVAQSGLIGVADVEEAVGVLLAVVHLAHECVALQNVLALHEEVQRVLLRHLYPLPNYV